MREALIWSMTTALSLSLMKLFTGIFTHSMAVIASALDSVMDFASSFVNFIAVKEAAKPPDEDHAYGHGKIESLAGLFQSLLIGLSGLYIFSEAIRRIFIGIQIKSIPVGLIVMGVSILTSAFLVGRLKQVNRSSPSLILATETLHYATDFLSQGGVMLALLLVRLTGIVYWDLAVSCLVSLYILRTSWNIMRHAIDELLDRSLPLVSMEEIDQLIRSYPRIIGVHNFRSRRVGEQIFLDFHVEIRGESDFKRAHDITETLIQRIQERYPGADVTVHYDPEGAS